ncbi:regulatory protein MerR [Caldithrix abyssi DSM 13497]|uniref:DNA-binding transcriptional regulator, MerR family n=1 Tax=Caldithrix abyssi DSM 13497 TaxID=880073 RepID=H1XQU1_CALAY|nr:MerR family transcriptional regulator [Caldithrix abyssi]APF18352.1 DNA-binding transcriptional regulator, MerR family [Caldithrix abyssi DSM 13497]EHO42364.1 regulatory protein MerR [Caldithrix abyssi DSM 13497]
MTIHELIEKSGFNRRTIYFYTQMELLPPPKGKGKSFEYSEEHLKRLHQIKKLQAMRYSLKEIRELLSRPDFSLEDEVQVTSPQAFRQKLVREPEVHAFQSMDDSNTLWRRLRIGTEAELQIKWPPSQETLENLENQVKELIHKIKGELK